MNRYGKSNRSKERRKWQQEMLRAYAHITWCEWFEGCGSDFGLAHAHTINKDFITTREEWLDVAKLCQRHHNFADRGKHERMYRLIKKCIAGRDPMHEPTL